MKRKLKKNWTIIFTIVAIICFAVLGYFLLRPSYGQGHEFLIQQEEKDTKELSSKLKEMRKQEIMDAINAKEIDVFSLFSDSVILGDSRVMGFSTYGFFQGNRVLAGSGHTIEYIDQWLDSIKSLNPSTIFLSYGVNDMGLELGNVEGGYRALYESKIDQILEVCPDATIVVNSIINASPSAVEESPRWNQVEEYNKDIKQMCEDRGWIYVDNSEICQNGNADIYQADGVHFLRDFYSVWAQNMIDKYLGSV